MLVKRRKVNGAFERSKLNGSNPDQHRYTFPDGRNFLENRYLISTPPLFIHFGRSYFPPSMEGHYRLGGQRPDSNEECDANVGLSESSPSHL